MANKSTRLEKEDRVFRVYKLICKGESRAEICKYAVKEWGVSYGTVDRYINEARVLLAEDYKMEREQFGMEILGGLRDLRKRSMADKQYGVALGCLSRMAAITGVDGMNNQQYRSKNTQ